MSAHLASGDIAYHRTVIKQLFNSVEDSHTGTCSYETKDQIARAPKHLLGYLLWSGPSFGIITTSVARHACLPQQR